MVLKFLLSIRVRSGACKMFEDASDEVRLKTLLEIVKNLMINSGEAQIFKLNEILRESGNPVPSVVSKEDIKEEIKKQVKEKLSKPKEEVKKEDFKASLSDRTSLPKVTNPRPVNFGMRRVLKIPKVNLPRHLSNIRPAATNKVSIDLGKLNPLVNDPNVRTIETEGENEIIYVTGTMGRKPTSIRLSKTEIEEVINRFAQASKIPKGEGMYKVAVGKLLLTAMISESVSPRFVIEKISSRG